MKPSTIRELLEQLEKGRIRPCTVDYVFIQLLSDSDEDTIRLLQENRQLVEVQKMLTKALREGDATSTNVLMNFRFSVSAEEAGNRGEAIECSKSLLSQIDSVEYPLTSAYACLKIGTALLAQTGDEPTASVLRESIEYLFRALEYFGEESPDLRCLAHYNLALAYNALRSASGDWDDDVQSKEAAIQHGKSAIDLMDQGAEGGNRLSLTSVLISLAMGGGERDEVDERNRAFVVKLVKGFLASPDAENADPDVRKQFKRFLRDVGESR